MMETKFTFKKLTARMLVVMILAAFSISKGYAQPSCACKTSINVSLNASGQAIVTPEMVLADGSTCSGGTVSISETPSGPPITGSPNVSCASVGKTLYAKVTSSGTPSNSCWATLVVEDKIKPVINCPTGIQTLTCTEVGTFNINSLVSDACGIEKVDIINEIITINNCSPALPDNVLKTIVRTYQATDKNGNVSEPCVVTFRVTTIPTLGPATINYPASYDVAPGNNAAIQCDDNYAALPNGNPNPLSTPGKYGSGAPFIGSINLFQDQSLYCGLLVTFSDAPAIRVNCVTKIIRTWQVFEWSCRNIPAYQYVQVIEVVDTKGPVVSGLSDLSASTANNKCEGTLTFANAALSDNCAATSSLTADITIYPNKNLAAPGIFIKHGASKTVSLPVGIHLAVYTAYDDCYNSSTASITVTVEDNTPPVAVCDEQATIGLTSDGTAWVPATVFDDGSFDECNMGKLLVRRMTPVNCQPCETPEFPGFKYIGTIGSGANQRYYYLSNHKATPKIALKTAKAMGGYGVSYENMSERNAVKGFVEAAGPDISFLIGMTDLKTEGSYVWETNAASTMSVTGNAAVKDYVIVESYPSPNPDNGRLLAVNGETAYRYVVEITDPCGWSSHAEFCCADIATPKMVALRAIDASGNFNDCMVNTIIQDKIGPTITCPEHTTVSCDFAYDPANLRKDFGWPEVTDNCENPNIVEGPAVISINNCRIGTITRSFTVTDMGGRTASCSQVITFAPTPSQVYNGPTAGQWPADKTMNGCGNLNDPALLPAVTGSPILTDGACSLVGSQYVDEVYSFNNPTSPACFKILRKWTVIDWCQPLTGGGYRTWTYVQEIKVIDNIAPVIAPTAPAVSADTFDPTCASGSIVLTANASDVCTSVLRWTYRIDAGNDGTFDITNTGNGNSINATNSYPVGVHKIVYSFEDKCGNVTSREQIFSIVNKKAPSVYVKQGLAMSLMQTAPGTGMAVIWASDFNNGSSHPCGYDLYYSFTPVTVQNVGGVPTLVGTPSATFDCGDRGENDVTIYVAALTPAGDVVQASVETFIDIQDNGTPKICPGTGPTNGGRATVSGAMSTENKEMVQNVSVTLMGAELNKMTGVDGSFGFADVPAGGQYTVMPEKNDDPLNGVSTLDLVFIQRHILNVQKLDSPYKLIAADANKDGKLTASDLVELRKLILGTSTSFSNNKSWRFVDKSYTFKEPTFAQGEAFPEAYYIDNLDTDMVTDFIAVKTGDVNGSVKASNMTGETVSRSSSKLRLFTNEQTYPAGTEIKVPVMLSESEDVSGMQFTLDFDKDALQLVHIDPAMSGMSDQNFGFSQLGSGKITFSWNADQPRSLSKDAALFTLTFKSVEKGNLSQTLALNSDVTAAEAYAADYTVMPVQMEVSNRSNIGSQSQKAFVLHQNVPNPFKEVANISYELPASMPVSIAIYNVSGKMIKEYNVLGQQGMNTLEINRNDLTAGILYYTMKAGDFTTTKKMVVIE